MGQDPAATVLMERILYSNIAAPPTVVDADGLNFLARHQGHGWWERFPPRAIVTPHPGEMARLTSTTVGEVEEDRVKTATDSAVKWDKVVVLKGAFTVVAFPSGKAMLSPFANPGLASAGTGDVLAGVIAGLLSQGMTLEDSAALGVYLHASAGELVRRELGDMGMLASDLLPALPRAIRDLRGQGPGV
jgi:NAD(P)H-hydrate epimerase